MEIPQSQSRRDHCLIHSIYSIGTGLPSQEPARTVSEIQKTRDGRCGDPLPIALNRGDIFIEMLRMRFRTRG
jgi:hypothetical protein